MITNFCDVAIGSRFEFRGKRYEKMDAEFGRDEERAGNLFHPRTEVMPMQKGPSGRPPWRMKNEGTKGTKRTEGGGRMSEVGRRRPEGWWLPKPEDRHELEKHDKAVMAAAELAYWRRPARKAGRLGREPDREIRAYGTL